MIASISIGSVLRKKFGPFLFILPLIIAGCEIEDPTEKEMEIFFGTVWSQEKVDYYYEGELIKSKKNGTESAWYVHYYEDFALCMSPSTCSILSYTFSDHRYSISPALPDYVITSVDNDSLTIETEGFMSLIDGSETFVTDHSIEYYTAEKQSSLASALEGVWHEYKMELYKDGQITNTWDVDTKVNYHKDGSVTYPSIDGDDSQTQPKYYILVGNRLGYSPTAYGKGSVYTVSINGDEMVQESDYSSLGTSKRYFRKSK